MREAMFPKDKKQGNLSFTGIPIFSNYKCDVFESLAAHNPRSTGMVFVNVITITAKG